MAATDELTGALDAAVESGTATELLSVELACDDGPVDSGIWATEELAKVLVSAEFESEAPVDRRAEDREELTNALDSGALEDAELVTIGAGRVGFVAGATLG